MQDSKLPAAVRTALAAACPCTGDGNVSLQAGTHGAAIFGNGNFAASGAVRSSKNIGGCIAHVLESRVRSSVGGQEDSLTEGTHPACADGMPGSAVGERSKDGKGIGLTAAAIVGNPFDLKQAARKLQQQWTMPWVYNLVLTFRCAFNCIF
jgi:hypothetical protein